MIDKTRTDWKARPPKRPLVSWRPDQPTGITIHHGGSFYTAIPDYGSILRSVQRQYQDIKDHTDIAYNLAVVPMPAGMSTVLAEARGAMFIGSANGDSVVNNTHLSLLVVGNYCHPKEQAIGTRQNKLNQSIVDTIGRAIKYIRSIYPDHPMPIVGHRDQNTTACPGGQLYDLIVEKYWDTPHSTTIGAMTMNNEPVFVMDPANPNQLYLYNGFCLRKFATRNEAVFAQHQLGIKATSPEQPRIVDAAFVTSLTIV